MYIDGFIAIQVKLILVDQESDQDNDWKFARCSNIAVGNELDIHAHNKLAPNVFLLTDLVICMFNCKYGVA